MADSADLDRIVIGVDEKQPLIAHAKSHFFGTALQGLHVPGTGFGETVESM